MSEGNYTGKETIPQRAADRILGGSIGSLAAEHKERAEILGNIRHTFSQHGADLPEGRKVSLVAQMTADEAPACRRPVGEDLNACEEERPDSFEHDHQACQPICPEKDKEKNRCDEEGGGDTYQ